MPAPVLETPCPCLRTVWSLMVHVVAFLCFAPPLRLLRGGQIALPVYVMRTQLPASDVEATAAAAVAFGVPAAAAACLLLRAAMAARRRYRRARQQPDTYRWMELPGALGTSRLSRPSAIDFRAVGMGSLLG